MSLGLASLTTSVYEPMESLVFQGRLLMKTLLALFILTFCLESLAWSHDLVTEIASLNDSKIPSAGLLLLLQQPPKNMSSGLCLASGRSTGECDKSKGTFSWGLCMAAGRPLDYCEQDKGTVSWGLCMAGGRQVEHCAQDKRTISWGLCMAGGRPVEQCERDNGTLDWGLCMKARRLVDLCEKL